MRIEPFKLERYYAQYEFTTRYMLSSSDSESCSVGDLLALEPEAAERLHALWLGYTESPGTLYDCPGHVRFCFGRLNMPEALAHLATFLASA